MKTKRKTPYAVIHEDMFGNVTNLGTVYSQQDADERVRKFKQKKGLWF